MNSRPALTRREMFTWWRDVFDTSDEPPYETPPRVQPEHLPAYLRPPGALGEAALVSTCERCHKCAEACPYDVILPLGPAYGAAEGTPAVLPRGGPCRLCDDLPCTHACPSGALRPLPLEQVRMGTARLDASRCWAALGQPCDYCVKECPLGERALRFESGRPLVIEETCTGCGMCVHICTADPAALEIGPAVERRLSATDEAAETASQAG